MNVPLCTICGHRPHTCVESPSGEAGPRPDLSPQGLRELADMLRDQDPTKARDEGAWLAANVLRQIAARDEAAPPPAGALHPLALAYLEAKAAFESFHHGRGGVVVGDLPDKKMAWEDAGCPIYTAAPPTLSAEFLEAADDLFEMAGHYTAIRSQGALTALEAAIETYGEERPNAARAPVTPAPFMERMAAARETPEPATVEPDNLTRSPWPGACTSCGGFGGHELGCKGTPASPPARPPAVTRTIRERIGDHVTAKQWDDRMLRVEALAAVVDGLVQVLDEDEARRDADRREQK